MWWAAFRKQPDTLSNGINGTSYRKTRRYLDHSYITLKSKLHQTAQWLWLHCYTPLIKEKCSDLHVKCVQHHFHNEQLHNVYSILVSTSGFQVPARNEVYIHTQCSTNITRSTSKTKYVTFSTKDNIPRLKKPDVPGILR